MFCQGINRFIFHRYAMQPWTNRWPGMTMGQWGIHFERTETWWQQGKPWIDYLTRCQFLLQQGRAVADAAYFDGRKRAGGNARRQSRAARRLRLRRRRRRCPAARRDGQNGRLILASGANYAVLILPA